MSTEDEQPQGDAPQPQGTEDDTTTTVETPQGEIDPAMLQAKLDKVIAESRKWEKRAKADAAALADMKARVQSMVEPEKVVDVETQLADTRRQLENTERDLLRYKVQAEKGLPPSLAKRLVGDTEEELQADADALLAELNANKPKAQAAKEGSNAGTTTQGVSSLKEAAEALKAAATG